LYFTPDYQNTSAQRPAFQQVINNQLSSSPNVVSTTAKHTTKRPENQQKKSVTGQLGWGGIGLG
jgi:hypothetical protein